MRIIEEYQNYKIKSLEIDSAKYIGDYIIRIHFTKTE